MTNVLEEGRSGRKEGVYGNIALIIGDKVMA